MPSSLASSCTSYTPSSLVSAYTAYYRRKFLQRQKQVDNDEEEVATSSDLGKDQELGIVWDEVSERTSTLSPVDRTELTVDAAPSPTSITLERTESWQSPAPKTTFVLVLFESWELDSGEDELSDDDEGAEDALRGEEREGTNGWKEQREVAIRSNDGTDKREMPMLWTEISEDCSIECSRERNGVR
jgi:hypothetical protein